MARTIFFAFLLFITISGFVGLLYYVMLRLMTPKGEARADLVVTIDPGEEDVDLLIRGAQFRATLLGDQFYRKVIIIDKSGDADTGELCILLCRELGLLYRNAADSSRAVCEQ